MIEKSILKEREKSADECKDLRKKNSNLDSERTIKKLVKIHQREQNSIAEPTDMTEIKI